MFIHLLIADLAGHIYGWNSGPHLLAFQKADSLIRQLVSTLEEQDMLRHTFLLVTSDHGGSGHNHGKTFLKSEFHGSSPGLASRPALRLLSRSTRPTPPPLSPEFLPRYWRDTAPLYI
jgi:Type I phosphodiesterase / nucleotide pyrophosphatase